MVHPKGEDMVHRTARMTVRPKVKRMENLKAVVPSGGPLGGDLGPMDGMRVKQMDHLMTVPVGTRVNDLENPTENPKEKLDHLSVPTSGDPRARVKSFALG
jgi:hypothetical protein